jgi:hypothetical protein
VSEAIVATDSMARVFRSAETAQWFREMLETTLSDHEQVQRRQRRAFNKRLTELENMQDRLLNTHLAGTIDEATFSAKLTEMKQERADVERQLTATTQGDLNHAEMALKAFDLSQNLVEIWRGSNSAVRRELLDCVSLNRTLSDVSLVVYVSSIFG